MRVAGEHACRARRPGVADIEDRHDVRVVEAGDGASLGQIGFGIARLGDQMGVRHLDRHRALELLIAGQVDAAEAALAEQPLDAVAADVRRVARRRGIGRRPRVRPGRSRAARSCRHADQSRAPEATS
jgi:hypothetical protein